MPKQIGLVSLLALVIMVYLIWQDPTGTADVFTAFFGAVGDFVATLWDKIGEFFDGLVN